MFVEDLKNLVARLSLKSRLGSCFSYLRDMVSQLWLRLHFQLGIWVVTPSTSLYRVRTVGLWLWDLAERCADYLESQLIKLGSKLDSILNRNPLKLGLLLLAVVLLLLVSGAVSLARALMSSLLMTQ